MTGEFFALLAIVTLPVTFPADLGAKSTANEADCFGDSVKGNANPETEKPVPLTLCEDRVTLALPVLVSVRVLAALLPVVTLPKLKEAGETLSCKLEVIPVPESAMPTEGVAELLASVSEPENEPAVVGENATVNGALAPGAMVSGRDKPEYVKPEPDSETCVMMRLALPRFAMVNACVLLVPAVTLPKLTDAGVMAICDCAPAPLRAIVDGELLALLVTVNLPE